MLSDGYYRSFAWLTGTFGVQRGLPDTDALTESRRAPVRVLRESLLGERFVRIQLARLFGLGGVRDVSPSVAVGLCICDPSLTRTAAGLGVALSLRVDHNGVSFTGDPER